MSMYRRMKAGKTLDSRLARVWIDLTFWKACHEPSLERKTAQMDFVQ